ncbi:MAG TPA: response regulator [Casimicrobiaceae bacterium]|nr:response regulator [Casimicrobiaceae bacterium]
MHTTPRILVVDDTPETREIMTLRLQQQGYDVVIGVDGEDALEKVRAEQPDLVLLDIMMPKLDGISVTKRLKADPSLPFIPIVLLTAKADAKDVIAGLDAGADDYLTKPVDHGPLVARVRSMLRIKELHDQVQNKTEELAALNRTLESRVAAQVDEIERVSRLKRFLAPQIAEMIVSSSEDGILQSHRRDIAVLFCDLRGFTAFAEVAEPEEVIGLLREYHGLLVPLVHGHEGTIDHFQGDGLMVFFNDPLPCPDPAQRAVQLALSMHEVVACFAEDWRARGRQIGFGAGIAQGFATLGQIGVKGCAVYSAIGTVANVASRLSAEAKDGQTLVTARVAAAVRDIVDAENLGSMMLKGLSRPTEVCNIVRLKK